MTRVPGREFFTVVENLKAARQVRDEGGYRCGLYASSIRYDGEQLTRMEAAVDGNSAVRRRALLAAPLWSGGLDRGGANGTVPVAGNPGRFEALRDPIPCWSIFTEGHITYDGRLSACCFDHDGRFTMGDLTTTGFAEAWNSAPFQALREAHLPAASAAPSAKAASPISRTSREKRRAVVRDRGCRHGQPVGYSTGRLHN